LSHCGGPQDNEGREEDDSEKDGVVAVLARAEDVPSRGGGDESDGNCHIAAPAVIGGEWPR
jgi:hypothetical protein